MSFRPSSLKIGILGAGQLGKMMAQEASRLDIELHFLDKSKDYPAGKLSRFFTEGDFKDFDSVMSFGRDLDVLGIEIEDVNVEALESLEKAGKRIIPHPSVLRIVQDKGNQKQFFRAQGYPTASFFCFESADSVREAINSGLIKLPFVQKSRKGGYDGKGVVVIRQESDLHMLLDTACVVEEMADILKELSVIVASDSNGHRLTYPCVEMEFHPEANLVEYLLCPAQIPQEVSEAASLLALQIANDLDVQGLLAVEMFWNRDGKIWVNELAPRPHNSGHQTLDNGACSQFFNQVCALAGLPLGPVESDLYAIMLNLVGEEGHSGLVRYEGLEECLALEGVHIHLYGKAETRPHRKMGHVCITDRHLEKCRDKANFVRNKLKVLS